MSGVGRLVRMVCLQRGVLERTVARTTDRAIVRAEWKTGGIAT